MKFATLVLSLMFLATNALAQERIGRHALIIGVSSYQDPAAGELKGVPYDVISAGKMIIPGFKEKDSMPVLNI